MFQNVLVYMGDLHLVLPSLNLCILDAGILIMVQQVSLMNTTCPSSCCPPEIFFGWTSRGDQSKMF